MYNVLFCAGGGLNERAIVDGHREKTLELLWRIIFHYQVIHPIHLSFYAYHFNKGCY